MVSSYAALSEAANAINARRLAKGKASMFAGIDAPFYAGGFDRVLSRKLSMLGMQDNQIRALVSVAS